MKPKNSDILEAKNYIKRRISAEVSMEHLLDRSLLKAAEEIVSLAYKRSIPPTLFSFDYDVFLSVEVDKVINRLIDEITEINIALSTQTEKADKKTLIPYIYRDINGINYNDRIQLYADKYKKELETFIKVGLVNGFVLYKTVEMIKSLFKNPYSSEEMSKYRLKGVSSYNRLNALTKHTIASAWMYADMEYAKSRGAIGFVPYRGSSYPCAECDSHKGRFHDFSEPYPPFHPNCVCYAVPIYNS